MAEEMMLSRINMAKSSYQLHNGQATWLRSKQHHPQWEDVCMHIHCMCVCSYLQFIYNLCGVYVCTLLYVCFWKCVHVCVPREL